MLLVKSPSCTKYNDTTMTLSIMENGQSKKRNGKQATLFRQRFSLNKAIFSMNLSGHYGGNLVKI